MSRRQPLRGLQRSRSPAFESVLQRLCERGGRIEEWGIPQGLGKSAFHDEQANVQARSRKLKAHMKPLSHRYPLLPLRFARERLACRPPRPAPEPGAPRVKDRGSVCAYTPGALQALFHAGRPAAKWTGIRCRHLPRIARGRSSPVPRYFRRCEQDQLRCVAAQRQFPCAAREIDVLSRNTT